MCAALRRRMATIKGILSLSQVFTFNPEKVALGLCMFAKKQTVLYRQALAISQFNLYTVLITSGQKNVY